MNQNLSMIGGTGHARSTGQQSLNFMTSSLTTSHCKKPEQGRPAYMTSSNVNYQPNLPSFSSTTMSSTINGGMI